MYTYLAAQLENASALIVASVILKKVCHFVIQIQWPLNAF